jgi:hypothetical protein
MKSIFIYNALIIITCLSGCNRPDEDPCGCLSVTKSQINDNYCSTFMYKGKPVLICLETGYSTLCDSDVHFDDATVLQNVGGEKKSDCIKLLDETYKSVYFDLTAYDKHNGQLVNDTIEWKHFIIAVFRSEDFDYPEGYGFYIKNTNTDYNHFQPILPIQGFVTCKTPEEALKVAFLRVARMYLDSTDFVNIEWDLELKFIGVID